LNKIVIGSRGSRLALIQTNQVKDVLQKAYSNINISIEVIRTEGDIQKDKPLHELGGKTVFTNEIEKHLLDKKIDLAVHSLKDLPSILPEGLLYVGSPKREDVRDVFVSSKWDTMDKVPQGGVVATGSIRRKAQLLHSRPDIKVVGLRGNVDTRLRKLEENNWDGIIIAAAALHRLELEDRISQYLDIDTFLPPGGQGALGLEISKDNVQLETMLHDIIHYETTCCCKAERAYLREIDASCFSPIGCFAYIDANTIYISAYSSNIDGTKTLYKNISGSISDAEKLAIELAEEMIKGGVKT